MPLSIMPIAVKSPGRRAAIARALIPAGRLALFAAFILILTACPHRRRSPDKRASAPPPASTLKAAAARHSVLISTAVNPAHLDDSQYTTVITTEFAGVEPENAMKFGLIHPRPNIDQQPYDFAAADRLVAFAQRRGMQVRGHTLVWHKQNPDWVTQSNFDTAQLNSILEDHIETVVHHFGTKIFAYDVVNEAFNDDGTLRDTIWYNRPGIGFAGKGTTYIAEAFEWAHAANPAAKLFYNDYDAEIVNKKSDAIYEMAREFKNRNVPINGIGFQMHLTLKAGTSENLQSFEANLKRFAELGLEIHITELDVRLQSDDAASLTAQAKLYDEIVNACLRQPACKMIQTWGFTDKYSWIPAAFPGNGWALPWDNAYQKKPAYGAMLEALQ
jgi:endo-1,4-beta-xylanase